MQNRQQKDVLLMAHRGTEPVLGVEDASFPVRGKSADSILGQWPLVSLSFLGLETCS